MIFLYRSFKTVLLIFCISAIFSSCRKEYSGIGDIKVKETEFKSFIVKANHFKIKNFYSEVPFDFDLYDGDPTLKTNLDEYISEYLLDDIYEFINDSAYIINQNLVIHPANYFNATINKAYKISIVNGEISFHFADHNYNDFDYILESFSQDYFITSYKLRGVKLFTKYERIP